jgi:hypothetical protein
MSAVRKPIGRPGFDDSKHVGLKMEAALDQKFIDKAKELRAKGFKTNKSELIRTLAEYLLDCAEDVYRELARKGEPPV